MAADPGERIKVLVVCGSLGVGGAEVQAARLLPRLNKELFDVQVAYYVPNAGFPKKLLEDNGIRVTYLSGTEWNKRQYLLSAVDFMKQERFDLVHAFQDSDNHYGRVPAILTGVPVVIGGLQGKRGLHGRWPLLYSMINFRCAGWIVNSRMLKEWAEQKMNFMQYSPAVIVRNGLLLNDECQFKRNEFTCYDQMKSKRPVIGIIGRLHPVKNHQMFIEMARLLTLAGVDADYWIIGEGEMRNSIEQTVKVAGLEDRIKLWGCREDVDAALCRMDIGVLTSDSESCPNALLEAMRASLPVVSTKCTSLEEIVEEGKNGFTVNVGDAQELANKVHLLLADEEKRLEMGGHSRKIIEQKFSIAAAVKDLENAYLYFLIRKSGTYPRLREKLADKVLRGLLS